MSRFKFSIIFYNWIKDKFTYFNLFVVASLFFFFVGVYFLVSPRDIDLYYYYNILDTQEIEFKIEPISVEKDLKALDKCKVSRGKDTLESCYLNFYQNYTIKNGPKMALSHLSTMISKDAAIIPGCHYITHGIGEGTYIRNGGDVTKSFMFPVIDYFTNIGSCGNGFYHGISIGLTRDSKTDDELYTKLVDFCMPEKKHGGGLGQDSCKHGLGHAIMLYYDHDRPKSLAMCDRLLDGRDQNNDPFGCYTGVMMEYGIYVDTLEILPAGLPGLKELCKEFEPNSKKRQACVVEGSGIVRGIYSADFVKAVNDCQKLDYNMERKACTKLNVIHTIRIGRSQDAKVICKILPNYTDRVECVTFFANYLANSVDLKHGPLYYKATKAACHTLDIIGYIKCVSINLQRISTFESNKDYGTYPNFYDLKVWWGGKRV
jgi:hypothetical protein